MGVPGTGPRRSCYSDTGMLAMPLSKVTKIPGLFEFFSFEKFGFVRKTKEKTVTEGLCPRRGEKVRGNAGKRRVPWDFVAGMRVARCSQYRDVMNAKARELKARRTESSAG